METQILRDLTEPQRLETVEELEGTLGEAGRVEPLVRLPLMVETVLLREVEVVGEAETFLVAMVLPVE
jgi:hypothetical protein